ncbi:MAG: hypothetical protein P8011_04090 [Acidihalobacter sp.]|jgi:hypothetical protein|uniref:hypothetical protein n=1 Tax=Acidihalobacter sp. TaxID=1872108 RepID=UPI00307ED7ED
MYNLLTLSLEDEKQAQETARRLTHCDTESPIRVSVRGNVVSVDVSNPLAVGIIETIGLVSDFIKKHTTKTKRRFVQPASL